MLDKSNRKISKNVLQNTVAEKYRLIYNIYGYIQISCVTQKQTL